MSYFGRSAARFLKKAGSKAHRPSKGRHDNVVGKSPGSYPRIDMTIGREKVSFRVVVDPAGQLSVKRRNGRRIVSVSLSEIRALEKRLASLARTSSMDLSDFSRAIKNTRAILLRQTRERILAKKRRT